jgi:hypothetical protein
MRKYYYIIRNLIINLIINLNLLVKFIFIILLLEICQRKKIIITMLILC